MSILQFEYTERFVPDRSRPAILESMGLLGWALCGMFPGRQNGNLGATMLFMRGREGTGDGRGEMRHGQGKDGASPGQGDGGG